MTRTCNRCERTFRLEQFPPHPSSPEGRLSMCYACKRAVDQTRRFAPEGRRKRMLWLAQDRARKKGIEFSITLDDVQIPERCPILGVTLAYGSVAPCDTSPTLDRIDPSKGYVRGNVAVISWRANRIKSDGTILEHEAVINYMRNHIG